MVRSPVSGCFDCWSMPGLKRRMLIWPTVAKHPTTACSLCLLSLSPKIPVKNTWISPTKQPELYPHHHDKNDFYFWGGTKRPEHNLQPQTYIYHPVAGTTGSRVRSLVRAVESIFSSPFTHVTVASQIYWSFLSLNISPHIWISDLYYCQYTLHFASHLVPMLTVDIWAQEEEKKWGKGREYNEVWLY